MTKNKNPQANNDNNIEPAEDAKNEAQELINSLKLDAQVPSSDDISDLSDVISNLQLDLPPEESNSDQNINLDLNLETTNQTEQPNSTSSIDESSLIPQEKKNSEEININISDLEIVGETQKNNSQTNDTSLTKSDNKESEEVESLKNEKNISEQQFPQNETESISENQLHDKEPLKISESQQKDSQQSNFPTEADFLQNSDLSKQENDFKKQTKDGQTTPQPDPFETKVSNQDTDQEKNSNQELTQTSPEAEQKLNSLESLIENNASAEENLSLEEEIPTSLEEAYETEDNTTKQTKKGLSRGILIGIGGIIVIVGGAVVFIASMPDVIANFLHKQQEPVSVVTQPQNTHPLLAQTGENNQNKNEVDDVPKQLEQTTKVSGQSQQELNKTNLTYEDLKLRLDDIQQLMNEVEFSSTKNKIRAKVLQKKIAALLDQGDLQKADYLLDQLEKLIYDNN